MKKTTVPKAARKRTKPDKAAATPEPDALQPPSKANRVVALLKRSNGATLDGIMAETGWQAHSVRGFISGQLLKKRGLQVKSFLHKGKRTYRIVQAPASATETKP